MRSQLTEALLLAAVGGAAGALIAWAGVPLLVRAAPDAVAGGFGGAPIPGLATAGLDLTTLLLHGRHLGSGGVRVRPAARAPLLRLAPGQSSAGRTRHRRRESHARCAGGRADRCCARPAGWIGAAHAQLLAAQSRRRRIRHEGHLHVSDRGQSPRPERPSRDVEVSVRVHGSSEGAARRRIRGVHHHAPAGRGRWQSEHHHAQGSRPAAPRRRSFASPAPAARTSRRWASTSGAAATSTGSRKNGRCRL